MFGSYNEKNTALQMIKQSKCAPHIQENLKMMLKASKGTSPISIYLYIMSVLFPEKY